MSQQQPDPAPYPPGQANPQQVPQVLVSTMNDVPGYRVARVYGEVFGLTVRSRNVGSQIGAGFKALAGGELKGMTKNLVSSRHEVMERMIQEAVQHGANAVLAMRFDTSEMGGNWTEICAYGTAVTLVPA
ncbi:MAG: YbjQ family protein [Acidimicrobiales bacterium]